jgi:hypothetical protein
VGAFNPRLGRAPDFVVVAFDRQVLIVGDMGRADPLT